MLGRSNRQFCLLLGRSGQWKGSRAGAKAGLMNETQVVGLAVPVVGAVTAWAVVNGDVWWSIRCIEGGIGCFWSGGGMGGNMIFWEVCDPFILLSFTGLS